MPAFHNPTAFTWIALAVPIVIFYLLKVRQRRVTVATLVFWQGVVADKEPRAIWRQLRHWFSLLLQLAFLSLLIFALADPFFSGETQQQRQTVIVLDYSASMQANDGGRTRFELARERIEQMIRALRRNDRMAIIAADDSARVLCGLTDHQRTLRNALESRQVGDGPTNLSNAIVLAKRLLSDRENGRAIVLTDRPPDSASANDQSVNWNQIATPAANVGITRFQVRRSLVDPVGFQTLIEISNFSEDSVERQLELKLDDELLDVIPLTLPSGDAWTGVFDSTSARGGMLTAAIDLRDALAADDKALAILPRRERLPVTLVTEGNWFLQQVLESNELVDLTVTSITPSTAPDNGLLILHRPELNEVPAGKVLVVQPTVSTDLWESAEVIEQPLVAEQNVDSPLMRHVKLTNLLLPIAQRIVPTVEFEPLVETAEAASLYLRIPRSSGDVLVLAIDLDQTDLPLRTAFPILMMNALSWFSDGNGELVASISTGQIARIPLPDELRTAVASGRIELVGPDGRISSVNTAGSAALVGPLSKVGIWKLRAAAENDGTEPSDSVAEMSIACNLTNATESNLSFESATTAASREVPLRSGGHPVWFYLVMLAWCLLIAEWFLFQRRRIA